MTSKKLQLKIQGLRQEHERLKRGKDSLLRLVDEAELPELVYNSNAIENSSLSLKETERILLEAELTRRVSIRELFEAQNLARVTNYLGSRQQQNLDRDSILFLHRMLLGNIDESIAGRFRGLGEYVRVGPHIAPAPEHVESLIETLLTDYASNHRDYFLDSVARFHLEFERIHPFVDGNGRIGRVLINWQLARLDYPPVIIRNKSKRTDYYPVFARYVDRGEAKTMERLLALTLQESLHKRLAYLRGQEIVRLSDWVRQQELAINSQLNAARRQTIPAFREKGCLENGGLKASSPDKLRGGYR